MKKDNKGNELRTFGKGAVLAVVLTAVLSAQALAAGAMPRAEITLSRNVLTVGDVFDGVTAGADHVLAPAPALGATMVLSSQDLGRISNAFNLGWYPAGNETAVVKRDAHNIGRDQIETALLDSLERAMPGQRFDVDFHDRAAALHLPAGDRSGLDIENLKYDLAKGEFRAVAVAGNQRRDISGRLFPVTEVPVLKKSLRSGDVIGFDDIQYIDMRNSDISANLIVSADSLVGQTPRRGISALKPVSLGEIVMPPAVKKGELVTMTLQSDIIQLTAQGRVLQTASVGDVVRVINTSSNQTIEAIVTGPRTVAVRPPSAALVNVPVRTSLDKG